MMDDVVVDTLTIVLGIVLVLFSRAVAREGVRQNNRFFRLGSVRLNFGDREEKVGAVVLFLVRIFFVVSGVLGLLGVG